MLFLRSNGVGTSRAVRIYRSIPIRQILKRTAVERSRIAAVAQPFAQMLEAEPTVEVARRVPVKHLKIDPLPAALELSAIQAIATQTPWRGSFLGTQPGVYLE